MSAPDFTETFRDWTEDASHENGQYQNICAVCQRTFVGHKRRFSCVSCCTPDSVIAHVRAQDADLARLRGAFTTIDTWMREGYDAGGCDRWICTPEGVDGPVETRSYVDANIEAPSLLKLAAAIDAARGA